ncbi:MAG: nucleotidyl transferase AbiEii/AbiGii toxin family protein [Succinivibrio sp.]|nr:nucleotidyl transferase AbiEii/AbiGii toxin family protein [Succinivibrio sp.]
MEQSKRELHKTVITNFLAFLNKSSDQFVLKGGTSLMMCYGLNRFSEDIDLDANHKFQFFKIVEQFCQRQIFAYRIAKDTTTTKRVFIHYDKDQYKPLKVELSLRTPVDFNDVKKINGILVYDINTLADLKIEAYSQRDALRDLFDVVFICKNYWKELNLQVQKHIIRAFSIKDLEYVDYLVNTQQDPLIDNESLANDFLDIFNELGLLSDYSKPSIEVTKESK